MQDSSKNLERTVIVASFNETNKYGYLLKICTLGCTIRTSRMH